jgi:6-pyruvoyltetrahydropterin/6-carboxytetrahydropterin synthase
MFELPSDQRVTVRNRIRAVQLHRQLERNRAKYRCCSTQRKLSSIDRHAKTRRHAAVTTRPVAYAVDFHDEITKDYLHFSAAHFTIFSATQRENLHGHNFDVSCSLDTVVGPNGLAFDYNVVKDRLMALCDELDERVLLPAQSPHLTFEKDAGYLVVCFADERIPFLERDALLLPIRNATVEEFARWFAIRLGADAELRKQPIESLNVRVSSGPGQWASSRWSRP